MNNENEKWFIVCRCCGEAFDAIETAKEHEACDDGFDVLPESEAM